MPPSPLRALTFLTTLFFLNFLSRIIFSPLLPTIEHDLGLTHSQAGLFFVLLSGGYLVSLLGSGLVSSRLNHRRTISLSMVSLGCALILIAAAPSLGVLRAGFVLLGLAAGLYLPSAIASISAIFPNTQWGKAFAVHELAPNLAFLAAPLIVSYLLSMASWQAIVLCLASFALAAGAGYLKIVQGEDRFGQTPGLAICLSLLTKRDFHLLVFLFALGISGTIGVFNVLPLFLVNSHAMPLPDANFLVGWSRVATLLAALSGGWLADRFGPRPTIAAVLVLTGLTTIGIGGSTGFMLLIFVFLQPVLAVCFFPAGFALLSNLAEPASRNVIISLAMPLAFLTGGGLLPYFITEMADRGLFSQGFIATGLLIVGGALAVRLVGKP